VNVFAIRHGETAWSLGGQHTGTTDLPLTDNGRRRAERLRPVLAASALNLVLCSPMRRAHIHEVAPGWLIFRDGCPGGESPEQVGARVDRVIARSRTVDGDIALFAHGHVLRVFAARWIGLPPSGGQHFLLNTGTLCILGYYGEYRPCGFGTNLSSIRS
jgi:probable phosphoglycerate mutase